MTAQIAKAKAWLINNSEFAHKALQQAGDVNINDCTRLLEALDNAQLGSANISYQLNGSINKANVPMLHLAIKASVPVLCQRCMGGMQHALNLKFDYQITNSAPDNVDDLDETDWLETAANMNLLELIEDELLLAMPIAPTHAALCNAAKTESGEKPNPFAVLKGKFKN